MQDLVEALVHNVHAQVLKLIGGNLCNGSMRSQALR
jgi:hypothetical protein